MKRVFAEIENKVEDIWGFQCPSCKNYHTVEGVDNVSEYKRCNDCNHRFIVTFGQAHSASEQFARYFVKSMDESLPEHA
ncbi:MAG: hypothetical protein EOP04_10370 [Proteobacteria bacterium]|nr:MAG: hypothetical protein EOP04_10370 [Pseudomonadota bacterium]